MNYFSKLPHLKPSIFSVMSALAQEHDAVNLSQGFPDFKGDQKLINLVSQAMNEGHNHYAPMSGVFSLREAIAKKYDLLYTPTIIVTKQGSEKARIVERPKGNLAVDLASQINSAK